MLDKSALVGKRILTAENH